MKTPKVSGPTTPDEQVAALASTTEDQQLTDEQVAAAVGGLRGATGGAKPVVRPDTDNGNGVQGMAGG
jgi:hypothetical protein